MAGRLIVVFALVLLFATATAQIRDQGLRKSIDEFEGTVVCEQQVIDEAHPNQLTISVALDERRVITFALHRSNLIAEEVVNRPYSWEDEYNQGVIFRFSTGESVGRPIEDSDSDVGSVVVSDDWSQTHTLIIEESFLLKLLLRARRGDIRYRLTDTDEGSDRQHFDGTISSTLFAPLAHFYTSCIVNR